MARTFTGPLGLALGGTPHPVRVRASGWNGRRDTENAFEAYTRLRDANQLEIDLDRNGSTIRKSYSVR